MNQIKEAEEKIVWVPIVEVIPNDKNRNKHPKEQIERLAEIIKYQGWRHPIIVSTLSGKIVAGHGRLEAAKLIGLQKVPVHYQSFLDATQETSFGISDNAIALWAELDMIGINDDLPEMGPEFDIDMLGIEKFELDVSEKEKPDKKLIECPDCGHKFDPKGKK